MDEPLHPFRWLPLRARKIAFVIALIAALGMVVAMLRVGADLAVEAAPGGIVTYEFAGDLATVDRILEGWGEPGRVLAGIDLGLDYLFLAAYATALALGCALAVPFLAIRSRLLGWLAAVLGWGQLLAGALDAVENAALIALLRGARDEALPVVAWWCAAVKFSLVAAGLGFLALVGIAAIVVRLRRSS